MTKLPPPRKSKQAALLAVVADWLRQHQAEEEPPGEVLLQARAG